MVPVGTPARHSYAGSERTDREEDDDEEDDSSSSSSDSSSTRTSAEASVVVCPAMVQINPLAQIMVIFGKF